MDTLKVNGKVVTNVYSVHIDNKVIGGTYYPNIARVSCYNKQGDLVGMVYVPVKIG